MNQQPKLCEDEGCEEQPAKHTHMTKDDWAKKYDAPEGQIWVCGACGKTASNRAGEGRHSYGWDESCFMWAVLCWDEENAGTTLGPSWRAVEDGTGSAT